MACPINFTCRAFEEGRAVAVMKGLCQDDSHDGPGLVDMEDVCGICSDWSTETSEDVAGAAVVVKGVDQPRRPARRPERAHSSSSTSTQSPSPPGRKDQHDQWHSLSPQASEVVVSHARGFPVKVSKKAVREEETVVCAVRRTSDGCYLIQKRPEKGESAIENERNTS